jgi:hypothetical protein
MSAGPELLAQLSTVLHNRFANLDFIRWRHNDEIERTLHQSNDAPNAPLLRVVRRHAKRHVHNPGVRSTEQPHMIRRVNDVAGVRDRSVSADGLRCIGPRGEFDPDSLAPVESQRTQCRQAISILFVTLVPLLPSVKPLIGRTPAG